MPSSLVINSEGEHASQSQEEIISVILVPFGVQTSVSEDEENEYPLAFQEPALLKKVVQLPRYIRSIYCPVDCSWAGARLRRGQ